MKKALQRFFNYFLIGVLGLMPIIFIVQLVLYVEQLFRGFFFSIHGYYENYLVTVGLFLVTLLFFAYSGYLLKNEKAFIIYYFEALLNRIPVLSSIYRVTKKLLSLFGGDDKRKLREVVYVEYPKEGLWVPAYVTNRFEDRCVLFIPTSPNPTSGFTVIVHESKVVPSQLTMEEASSFIISIGVDYSKPEEVRKL